jgi:transposase-like protein
MKQKTARVKSWDPTTQRYKYETVKVEGYYFNDEDRMRICSEWLESGEPASVIMEKYHLNSKEVLYGWVKKFLEKEKSVPLESFVTPDPMKEKSTEAQLLELKAENRRLQDALDLANLRAKAYETMIEVAEQNLNVAIRKKAGTKQ